MNASSLDLVALRSSLTRQDRVFPKIDLPAPPASEVLEIMALYHSVAQAGGEGRGALLQFVCMNPGEGCEHLALTMVQVATGTLRKRILLLDGTSVGGPELIPEFDSVNAAFTDAALGKAAMEDSIAKVPDTELFVAKMRSERRSLDVLGAVGELGSLLAKLRPMFDMIVVVPPPLSIDPLGALMAPQVDGSVLVVASECTRKADALRMRELLSRSGGVSLGVAMTGCHDYVPRWLRRFV